MIMLLKCYKYFNKVSKCIIAKVQNFSEEEGNSTGHTLIISQVIPRGGFLVKQPLSQLCFMIFSNYSQKRPLGTSHLITIVRQTLGKFKFSSEKKKQVTVHKPPVKYTQELFLLKKEENERNLKAAYSFIKATYPRMYKNWNLINSKHIDVYRCVCKYMYISL